MFLVNKKYRGRKQITYSNLKSCQTSICKARASNATVSMVGELSPRSIEPYAARLIPAISASSSCEYFRFILSIFSFNPNSEDDSGSRAEACSENNFSVLFLPEVEFVYSVNNIMFKAILLTCSLIIFFKL